MSRSTKREAAILALGALLGAGGFYVSQNDPGDLAKRAHRLFVQLIGDKGEAHADGARPAPSVAEVSKKDERGHDRSGDAGKDGHDHGEGHRDGDGHDHDEPDAAVRPGGNVPRPETNGRGHDHGDEGAHKHGDDHGSEKEADRSESGGHKHGEGDKHDHSHDKPRTSAEPDKPVNVAALDAKEDGHDHGHGPELPDGVVELSDAKVKAAGVGLVQAGPATLREELQLNGLVQANQEAVVQVTPRFPGVVRTVAKRLGDEVRKGELLAVVESNQSLTTYELKAPISGVITERQASLGEYVSEQKPAFVVTDLSTLWVDFSVYRRDLTKISVGEIVRIDPEDGGEQIEAKISYVAPIGAADTQSAVARAVIGNDGRFRPGLFATGSVATAEQNVRLAVSLDAVQSLEGRNVVFVREGDRFVAKDVTLGRRDGRFVEVLTGLEGGEAYAAKNSFVVKAELAKGSASHEH